MFIEEFLIADLFHDELPTATNQQQSEDVEMPSRGPQSPPSSSEKIDAARVIVDAIGGLHHLAEGASLPFLGYLIRMVEAEATTVIASAAPEAEAPH